MNSHLIIAALILAHPVYLPAEPPAHFEIADVRISPRSAVRMTGGFYHGGRFEVRSAEMLDLISIAYAVDFAKVTGGPSWLEWDRFDVTAKAASDAPPEELRSMLRTLLAERFSLVVHKGSRNEPTCAIVSTQRTEMTKASGTSESGCKRDFQNSAAGRGAPVGGGPVSIPTYTYSYACHNVTMQAFGETIRTLIGRNPNPILDETGLRGSWDFNFKYSFQGMINPQALFDAVEKQVGLRLEPRTAPQPVIEVDSVGRKPTENAPGVNEEVAGAPRTFDVADIKLSDPNVVRGRGGNMFQPGGRVNLPNFTLRNLIVVAWDLTPGEVVGGPGFLDTTRFDIVAKAPLTATSASTIGETPVDMDALRAMLRTLLRDRFQLETHTEERPVNAYTLTAAKPKLERADPSDRTACHEGPRAGVKDPRIVNPALNRVITCRNMTMDQFAENLFIIASGYFQEVSRNVLNATGLDGAYDFTLAFSGASTLRSGAARAPDPAAPGGISSGPGPEPDTSISLQETMQKDLGLRLETKKRSLPVLVVDHMERMPTDN